MLPATSPEELAAMRGAKQIPWMAISRHRELLAKLHALLVDRISVEQKKDIGLELALGMARTVSDVDVLIKKLEGELGGRSINRRALRADTEDYARGSGV
jgi:hypothetical protein